MIDGDRLAADMLTEMRSIWHALVIAHDSSEAARRVGVLLRGLVRLQTGKFVTLMQAHAAARAEEMEAFKRRAED